MKQPEDAVAQAEPRELPEIKLFSTQTVAATFSQQPVEQWILLGSKYVSAASITQLPAEQWLRYTGYGVQAASYRVAPFAVYLAQSSARVSFLTKEAPEIYLGAQGYYTASFNKPPLVVRAGVQASRVGAVISEAPELETLIFATRVATRDRGPLAITAAAVSSRVAILHRMPPVRVYSSRAGFIFQQAEGTTTPARVAELYEDVAVSAHFRSPGETVSDMDVLSASVSASIARPAGAPPISDVTTQSLGLAYSVEAVGGLPWSDFSVRQGFMSCAALAEDDSPADFWISEESFGQGFLQVAASSVYEYVPISGLSIHQSFETAAVDADYPSTSFYVPLLEFAGLSATWSQKASMGRLPQSLTRVSAVGMLLSKASPEQVPAFPQAQTDAVSVGSFVSAESDLPVGNLPLSRMDVLSACVQFSSASDTSVADVGPEDVSRLALSYASAAATPEDLVGVEHVITAFEAVAVAATYPSPGLSDKYVGAQNFESAAVSAPPPSAWPQSATSVRSEFINIVKFATYPSPGSIAIVGARITPQLFEQCSQESVSASTLPLSRTRNSQIWQSTAANGAYPTTAQVINDGVFLAQVLQATVSRAAYESVHPPESDVETGAVMQQVLLPAFYVRVGPPESDARVEQLANIVVSSASYFDKNAVRSEVFADLLVQPVQLASVYPDKMLVQSVASAGTIVQTAVTAVLYPDKMLVQSSAVANYVLQQVASGAAYPDKSQVQSQVQSQQVLQQVLQPNEALSELPVKKPKHRAQISIVFL